jgi:hypothetical protein
MTENFDRGDRVLRDGRRGVCYQGVVLKRIKSLEDH